MSKRVMGFICWLLAVMLTLNSVAADSVGMMSTIGNVLVDNRPATATGTVFAGEVIETKTKSKAVVISQGKTVSLGENSTLRLDSKEIELRSGAVMVASTNGVLRVDTVTIAANSGAASKFLARKVNGAVQVLVLEGTVSVNNGQETTQVPATKGVSIGSPGKHISWLLNDDIGVLIVVAAAITAGVTLGIVNAQNAKPVSPAVP